MPSEGIDYRSATVPDPRANLIHETTRAIRAILSRTHLTDALFSELTVIRDSVRSLTSSEMSIYDFLREFPHSVHLQCELPLIRVGTTGFAIGYIHGVAESAQVGWEDLVAALLDHFQIASEFEERR